MVDIYSAYKILNSSVADLADQINKLEPAEDVRANSDYVRLEEEDFLVTERGKRLASKLTAAYDLSAYRKNFYVIESSVEANSLLEQLMMPIEDLDLTEFSMEGRNGNTGSKF